MKSDQAWFHVGTAGNREMQVERGIIQTQDFLAIVEAQLRL